MSLLDVHAPDLETAASNAAWRPVEPGPAKFSAWSAVPRGIGEAGAQVAGTAADLAASFRYMRDATPEQRKQIDRQGVPLSEFSSKTGDDLRDFGKTLRPDPQTASAAESVLYGFARGASKVVAGAVFGGLPGVLAAGVEEGITQSDELRRQGVDVTTRSRVGLVQGAGLALAALPAAGSTLKGTLALYAAGGPGGFVAQQALTREILANAGQDKLAAQFDPFDPVGLAVSALVPAPFAAWGLRGARKAAAKQAAEEFRAGPVPSEPTAVAGAVRASYSPEVVDAAMVTHLVERAQRADEVAASIVRPVESLAAFTERGGYKAPKPEAEPKSDGFLAWLKGAGGIDMGEKFDITGEKSGILSNPAGIFRRGGRGSDDLASQAASAGYLLPEQAGDSGALIDLVKRAVNGDRVMTFEQQQERAMLDHVRRVNEERLTDLESRLRLLGIDPADARGNPDAMQAYLAANEPRLLAAALDELTAARQVLDDAPEVDALRQRAQVIVQDMEDGGRTLEQYEAEVGPLSPVMRRTVEQEMARTTETARPPAEAQPSALKPRDLQAEMIGLRKQVAVLNKLLECLNG